MAYTRLSPVLSTTDGAAPVAETTDATNGNTVLNASSMSLHLENNTEADVTATFITSATLLGYAVEDLTVTLAAAETRVFGHFPTEVFGSNLEFTTSAAISARVYR